MSVTTDKGVRTGPPQLQFGSAALGRPRYQSIRFALQIAVLSSLDAIEDHIVSLAQYPRARIVALSGPRSLPFLYIAPTMRATGTGLTWFNPFSSGFDYNAELSTSESQQQRSASSAAVATLRDEHQFVSRDNPVPKPLCSGLTQNAAPGTFSSPLPVSTYLLHSTGDVDRLVEALTQVVPTP